MAYLPPNNGLNASQLVNDGWQFFQGKSGELMSQVDASLQGITTALYGGYPPQISFSMPPLESGTFVRPIAPNAPTFNDIDASVPGAPSLAAITLDALPAIPGEPDFSGMVLRTVTPPNVTVPARPADLDVTLVDINFPDAPVFTMPTDPVLLTLNLPQIPTLDIPAFDGVRPAFNLTAPTDGLGWTYTPYNEATINTIKGQLSSMTLNGLALPAAIEQAIFDRARGREDTLSAQQVSEATRALASRGLRQPSGLMFRALERIRTEARIKSSGASRDLAIEIAKENIESIKFGLSQAIALESTLLQSHVQIQGLLLDAAKAAHAALVEVFNSQVALHNAQWEGFKAEAQVYESRLRALAVQVDMVKAAIEAEKVKGDINEGLVRAFAEKVRALSSLADMYRAQVEAAKAKGEINTQRLEQVRLRLQAYGVDVDAYSKQWDAYAKQAEAETMGIRYYEALGNVFSTRVNAWRGQVEAQSSRANTQIAANAQQLDLYRATLSGIQTHVQAQVANVDAATRVFSAQASMFGTEAQVSQYESAAADRTSGLKLEQSKLAFESASQNAKITADYALKKMELAVEASRGASQVWGQLSASVLSGVNLGASISYGESEQWSWSGEI